MNRHCTRLVDRSFFSVAMLACVLETAAAEVNFLRVPDGGIQPQALTDPMGAVHLLYFKGEPSGGDLFYVRRSRGESTFSRPIRVNSQPASAIATGTIRGGQLALGQGGRIHVAWNGHAPVGGNYMQAPMLYTRLNTEGTAFEPERDVIGQARGLDGGGSVAADSKGNVYVTWHAPKPGNTRGEVGRAVFLARSRDDGRSFAPERLVYGQETGACGCCGMKTFVDSHGSVFLSYRGASESGNRDQIFLAAHDGDLNFRVVLDHPWKVGACPMSSTALVQAGQRVLGAWETAGKVYWTSWVRTDAAPSAPVTPPDLGKNPKHPVVVGNSRGETLLAWTEGTGWARGGDVAWQRFDATGKPMGEKGMMSGLPTWSLVAAVTDQEDRFVVIY